MAAKRITSLFLALCLVLSLFAGFSTEASAAAPTSADEVVYVRSGSYVYNWGKRGTTATFLTTYAASYYTGSYTYDTLSALAGSSASGTAFYTSELGTALHSMLVSKQTYANSYEENKTLFQYTECEESSTTTISSYYSGTNMSNAWGSGWNREHTWPNSKGLDGKDESDVMMIKPTLESENSDRGNKAYGESGGYYHPNSESSGKLDLRGDTARLMLQHLMRWGNTGKFYGSQGVMENRAVLLEWMEADPVDTWEMGRNDAVQQITGVRNVFVDYPELAYKLLGAELPANYPTPSGSSLPSYSVTAVSNNTAWGTVSVSGCTVTAEPAEGYYVKDCTVLDGTATWRIEGNVIYVVPASDCSICVNFAAKESVTLTLMANGALYTEMTVYAGEETALPTSAAAAEGYSFGGWTAAEIPEEVTAAPVSYTVYTPTGDATLYALYTRSEADTGSGEYARADISAVSAEDSVVITENISGTYYAMTNDKGDTKPPVPVTVTVSDGVITSEVADELKWNVAYSSGTFEIYPEGETGKWLYCTNANNGVRVGTGDSKSFRIDSDTGYLFNNGQKRYLGIYNKQDWRCYTSVHDNIKNQTITFFVMGRSTVYYTTLPGGAAEHGHVPGTPVRENVVPATCTEAGSCDSVVYCIGCGEELSRETVTEDALGHDFVSHLCTRCDTMDFAFSGHSCSFNNNLSVNYYLPYEEISALGTVSVTFEAEGKETVTVTDPKVTSVNGVSNLRCTYSGIAAAELGREITAIIRLTVDGKEYCSEPDRYSVARYAYSRIANSTDEALIGLCASLLNYGAAAQVCFGVDTDHPVNADLDDAMKTVPERPFIESDSASVSENASVRLTGKSAILGNKVDLKFYVSLAEGIDLADIAVNVSYRTVLGERINFSVKGTDFAAESGGEYSFKVEGIAAANFSSCISVALVERGVRTASYTYSLETYCSKAIAKDGQSDLAALCKALMAYRDAAAAYFG